MEAQNQNQKSGFSRQEALTLTGSTPANLSYLDKSGIVVPQKAPGKRPAWILYSAEQVVCLKIIVTMRNAGYSMTICKKLIKYLEDTALTRDHVDNVLYSVNGNILFFCEAEGIGSEVMAHCAADPRGSCVVIQLIRLRHLLQEICEAGRGVPDFDKRAMGTLLTFGFRNPATAFMRSMGEQERSA